ncbi:uncharacterized protein BT62DRAFT_937712 [Guyanagaster necrorhizus]|uniref:Uncharacterized protein n=1 Tax=Guyanagaster necrorhizus TaxID=856835 RepID=A0A9P7VHN8_9AGAR|nr:uncharacterized protein BT62DRAFT_937712 [Guyanagaster necrorhizus MCA 3950]KAG7440742.1 hypothetical protein BT62DRAFT_937712 [Guyanagaster necrorhizus MCA 3950]
MAGQTRACIKRLPNETLNSRRRSTRLLPHVPFKFYETPTRKQKSKKRKAKKLFKSIRVEEVENDDDYSPDAPSSTMNIFSAGVPSATSPGPVPAGERATIPTGMLKNVTIRKNIHPGAPTTATHSDDSFTRVLQNNLAAAKAMEQEAELFEEAHRGLDPFNRRLSRNRMAQKTDKGKMKNSRISMEPKTQKYRKRVRARSQSVIAMQLGMGLHLPRTPVGSRQNTPTPSDISTRENTPVPGPSMHPGALDLPLVPTRQNTPQVEAGPSVFPGSLNRNLNQIEEESMDMDIEFDPSK